MGLLILLIFSLSGFENNDATTIIKNSISKCEQFIDKDKNWLTGSNLKNNYENNNDEIE